MKEIKLSVSLVHDFRIRPIW